MPSAGKKSEDPTPRRAPARTPRGRELQLTALAYEQAERMLIEGKAPTPVIMHYLKLDSERERLEREKLELEKELLRARAQNMRAMSSSAELYGEALAAFRGYRGEDVEEEFDYDA